MGKQTNFYITTDDRCALERKLREKVTFVTYAWKSEEPGSWRVDLPCDGSVESNLRKVLLVKQDVIPAIKIERIDDRDIYFIDVQQSPVVEYSRGYDDSSVIRPGRLYYVGGYFNDRGAWIEKDDEFRKWADQILRVARTFFKKRRFGSFYLGENAAQALAKGAKLSQV